MHQMPLEYRILTALLLGRATSDELALRLSMDRFTTHRAVRSLTDHRMVVVDGRSDKKWPAMRHSLTPAGRRLALEVIGGAE